MWHVSLAKWTLDMVMSIGCSASLFLVLNWIKSSRDVIVLNVLNWIARCRMFGTWIGWIAKTFDYINCVTKRFRFWSTRVRGHTLPARCYASPR